MKFQGFIGPTYSLDSVNVDCQRCVNLIPEIVESGTGKEAQKFYYRGTPGMEKLFEVGDGPIRMIYADSPEINSYSPNNRLIIASGSELFRASFISGSWEVTKIMDLFTSTGPIKCVSMKSFPPTADNPGIPGVGGITPPDPETKVYTGSLFYLVDNKATYHYYIYYNNESPHDMIDDYGGLVVDTPAGLLAGTPIPSQLAWIDGFTLQNSRNTNRFYSSGFGTFTFDALDFASAEGDPDFIVAMLAMNRDLWLFNERSIEVWTNSGNADFPFQRLQGGFIEKGCVAAESVRKIDGTACWLGRDEFGQGIVYAARGLTPERISTHAVEQAIQSYADISSATAYTYQSGGHSFYVLNFAEATWAYDFKTGMWHERAYTNGDGDLERHRAEHCAFIPALNLTIVGDYETNEIFALKEGLYTDNGGTITRMRVAPHLSSGGKFIYYNSLLIDMETGVGLDGAGLGSDPQIMLDWSNDGGHTWSSESWASIGKKVGGIGDYKKRVKFNRLGRARDRVFRLKITDPVKVVIMGADLDFEVGAS